MNHAPRAALWADNHELDHRRSARGPGFLMEDYLPSLSLRDGPVSIAKRIPERVVHAKAAGRFKRPPLPPWTGDITKVQPTHRGRSSSIRFGKKTECIGPIFSTVPVKKGSPINAPSRLSPRVFFLFSFSSVQFYQPKEAIVDMTGNNTPSFLSSAETRAEV